MKNNNVKDGDALTKPYSRWGRYRSLGPESMKRGCDYRCQPQRNRSKALDVMNARRLGEIYAIERMKYI